MSQQWFECPTYVEFLCNYRKNLKKAIIDEISMEESTVLADKCPNLRIDDVVGMGLEEVERVGKFAKTAIFAFDEFYEMKTFLELCPVLERLEIRDVAETHAGMVLEFKHVMRHLKSLQIDFCLTTDQFVQLISKTHRLEALKVRFGQGELAELQSMFSKVNFKHLEILNITERIDEPEKVKRFAPIKTFKNIVDFVGSCKQLSELVVKFDAGTWKYSESSQFFLLSTHL